MRPKRAAAPEQCLFYLEESHKRDVCRENFGRADSRSFGTVRENRYWFMSGLRLRHCCEHKAVNALAPGKAGPLEAVLNGGEGCVAALDKLLLVDALAARLHCEFQEVLARYDCGQTYSVIHNCTHCKEAYRKWVCSSLVPYFAHGGPLDLEPSEESWTGRRLRPCRSLCQSVEQRCPYLLPGDRAPAYPTQYAGEPIFLCRDPNIPETGEQAARALHPDTEDECCINVCSEDEPALGVCANCTGRVPYMGPKHHDPPTAPQCDITSLPGQQQQQQQQQVTRSQSSLCGTGGIGTMTPNANTLVPPLPRPETSGSGSGSEGGSEDKPTEEEEARSSSSSSSSASPSPVPLICLFGLWGVLVTSQCSVRRLVGLADRCFRVRCLVLRLLPARGRSVQLRVATLVRCCYRRWLWPGRWKRDARLWPSCKPLRPRKKRRRKPTRLHAPPRGAAVLGHNTERKRKRERGPCPLLRPPRPTEPPIPRFPLQPPGHHPLQRLSQRGFTVSNNK